MHAYIQTYIHTSLTNTCVYHVCMCMHIYGYMLTLTESNVESARKWVFGRFGRSYECFWNCFGWRVTKGMCSVFMYELMCTCTVRGRYVAVMHVWMYACCLIVRGDIRKRVYMCIDIYWYICIYIYTYIYIMYIYISLDSNLEAKMALGLRFWTLNTFFRVCTLSFKQSDVI